MWPNSKTSFFEQWCAVLQISNKFWKIHVRSSTVQDSNTDNNRAVRETVEKRYSQDKLCMGFQNFLEQLLFRFKDRKRTIRTIPNSEAVICKNSVLRNFAKFTGKRLCQSLFFNKVYNKSGIGVFMWILRNFKEHRFLQNISSGCFC